MFEAFRHDISNNRTALMEKMSFDFEIMIYDYQSRYENTTKEITYWKIKNFDHFIYKP